PCPLAIRVGFISQQGKRFFEQRVHVDAVFLAHNQNGTMLDKFVWPTDPHYWCSNSLGVEMLHYRTAETVMQNVILHSADNFHTAREEFERPTIERFDPPRID